MQRPAIDDVAFQVVPRVKDNMTHFQEVGATPVLEHEHQLTHYMVEPAKVESSLAAMYV